MELITDGAGKYILRDDIIRVCFVILSNGVYFFNPNTEDLSVYTIKCSDQQQRMVMKMLVHCSHKLNELIDLLYSRSIYNLT